MINISNIIKTWPKNECGWSIAPSGFSWIQEGSWIKCGENVEIGNDTTIGEYTTIGTGAKIGEYTTIGTYTKIGNNTKIGNDTKIGEYTKIGNYTKIGEYTTIGTGAEIGNDTTIGNDTKIGEYTKIGNYTNLGASSKVLDNSTECVDLGFYDGYRKVLCLVNGQARIASGCRDFSISEALEHWGNHEEDRKMTFACIKFAKELAEIRGFSYN